MQNAHKLSLVGIGYRPLSARAHAVVKNAGTLLASSRLLDVFKRYDEYEAVKDRIQLINGVPETVAYIKKWFLHSALHTETRPDLIGNSAIDSLVLLASGDPFFFGIGRRMADEFGKERIEIIPDLSSMQEAFARINVPWDDAFCISVHGGPDIAKRRALPYDVADIPWLLQKHGKLAILTDKQNNPAEIARVVNSALRTPHSALIMHVCERLGYPDERIWMGTVGEAADMTFAEPNVMIIQRQGTGPGGQGPGEVGFGLKEDELAHRDGLITKDEVRAVSIHKLRLPTKGHLWDIGAGSGSVAIEAARIFPGLKVIAVERDEEQVVHLKTNRAAFDVRNVEIVHGPAPGALAGLAVPDRVFIGGSGGHLEGILAHLHERMRSGIVVVNAITLETLNQAISGLEQAGFAVSVSEISVSRSKIIAGRRHMTAQNPIFIVTGEKRENAG